jgi:hypothetical protein
MKTSIYVFLCLLAVSCSSIQTSYDYDKNADFSKYKSYAFADNAKNLQGLQQLDRDRILAAVDAEMVKLGYEKSDTPDAIVDIHVKTEEQMSATATTSGGGYRGYGYGGGFTTTNVNYNTYTDGTLFVTLVDKGSEKIVWQGRATKTLNEKATPERKETNINAAVAAIFRQYPKPK